MFEIHITVNTNNIDKFKTDCLSINCKPIVIEVQNENYLSQQVMTSSKYNHFDFITEASQLKETLLKLNYLINRIKVEVHPDHVDRFSLIPKYYESHLRVLTPRDKLAALKDFAVNKNWHFSRNVFKSVDDDQVYQMLTYRQPLEFARSDFEYNFKFHVEEFSTQLKSLGYNVDKIEVEACILDTNEELDKQWLEHIVD